MSKVFSGKKKKKSQQSSHPTESSSSIDFLAKYESELQSLKLNSNFFHTNPITRPLPNFPRDDLEFGSVLGIGGFCKVYEIVKIHQGCNEKNLEQHQDEDGEDEAMHQTNLYMANNTFRDNAARYAVKILRTDLNDDKHNHRGMYDLAIEAAYLSVLNHPNIVKMRGSMLCDSPVKTDGFFIIIDRLYGTLQEKIDGEWSRAHKESKGSFGGLFKKDKTALKNLFLERLLVAHDLATVFRYLHEKRIIYRDLRPENAGFDVRGDIKLFDFGLCKEIRHDETKAFNPTKVYKFTSRTGSIPYMAPEIMLCKKYNHKVDTYSFGILLWELFALKIPMKGFNNYDYVEKVCKKGFRPNPNESKCPVMTQSIMKECWAENSLNRPEFARIATVIRGEMNDMTDENDGSIRDRTFHLLNRSKNSQHNRNFTR
mmetsp:Transcript_14479/g.16855  ORF Transcript_14479/g.16855 Transcript_14479/m.16855 type:complete len:427 (-) Transcript_14479:153-1433(-)